MREDRFGELCVSGPPRSFPVPDFGGKWPAGVSVSGNLLKNNNYRKKNNENSIENNTTNNNHKNPNNNIIIIIVVILKITTYYGGKGLWKINSSHFVTSFSCSFGSWGCLYTLRGELALVYE